MAIDQKSKQLNIVDRLITQATLIDDALEESASLIAQHAQAGTLTNATLENSELKHINADDVTTLIGGLASLLAWINDAYRRDTFRKVRR